MTTFRTSGITGKTRNKCFQKAGISGEDGFRLPLIASVDGRIPNRTILQETEIMFIRRLTKEDYSTALTFFDALDEMHCIARPDCFQKRDIAYPLDAFLQVISEPDCLMIGAFEEMEMLGLLRASVWREKTVSVCVDSLYVKPAFRRKGIASSLMKAAEDWAGEKEALRIELHVWDFNRDALSLYQKLGMTPQRYILEKDLRNA